MQFKVIVSVLATIVCAVALVAASGAGAAKAPRTGQIDVSTKAAVVHYLRSIHVNTKGVVIQRGLRNYAGRHCPGKGWTCAGTRHTVVQIAKRGGLNRYACTTAKCAVVQIGSASRTLKRFEAATKPPPPPLPNTALCVKTTGVTQSCVINQPNASGTNQAIVWMVTPKNTGLTQSSYYAASITQGPSSIGTGGSSTNSNIACVKQSVWLDASTTKTNSTSTTVTNDNHELITVTQNSLTGTNAVQGATQGGTQANPTYSCDTSNTSQLQQDELLTSVVNSKGGSITQKQDTLPSTTNCVPASDPSSFSGCANVVTDIEQNKGSGFFGVAGQGFTAGQTQNTANFEQSTRQVAIANTPSGTVTQQQNANVTSPPFSGLVGTINQDSKAQSTATVKQDETQCQDAVSVSTPIAAPTDFNNPPTCPVAGQDPPPSAVHLTQTQYGPEGVLTPSKNSAGPVFYHTKGYGRSQQTNAGPNMYDTFNVTQTSHQFTDQPTAPNQLIRGDCASSGNGDPNGGACNVAQNAFVNNQPIADGYTAGSIANLLITCTNGGGTANCSATPPPFPTITATSEPSNPTESRSAAFSWTDAATSGPSGSVTFKCNVTGVGGTGGFVACNPGDTFSGLGTGSHTFSVEAVDKTASQNASDPTQAQFTWTIVDANISLSPATATRTVGNTHTVTCAIQQDIGDGNGFVAAPDGTTCIGSVLAGGPNAGSIGSCTTTSGSCTITYTGSGGTGTDTIHATTTFTITTTSSTTKSVTRSTGDGVSTDGADVSSTWVVPVVTNVTSSTPDGTYGVGQPVSLQVVFSGPVNVDTTGGTPTLALNSGGTASYTSGTGTSTLTFTYVVGAGENSPDLDYTSVSALGLNGGTIKDTGTTSHNANLTLPSPGAAGSLGANKNIVIDTPPVVTNVTSTAADGPYTTAGVAVPVLVTFSEPVVVDTTGGTPNLALNTNPPELASYTFGTGSDTLTFTYTTASPDNSPDLDYTSASALSLNGGTIKDTDGVSDSAVMTLPAPGSPHSLGGNKNIVINVP